VIVGAFQNLLVVVQITGAFGLCVGVGHVAERSVGHLDDFEGGVADAEGIALVGVLLSAVDLGHLAVECLLAHPVVRQERAGIDLGHRRRIGLDGEKRSVGA